MNGYFLPTIDDIGTFENPFHPNCSSLQLAQKIIIAYCTGQIDDLTDQQDNHKQFKVNDSFFPQQ